MGIKSNLGIAQARATALKNATESLNSSSSADKDSQTTVLGNSKAHSAIDSTLNVAKIVSGAVTNASSNINTVAGNFEAVDQAGKTMFSRKTF